MNNKIIAAGVVVALCAVALIGVGYAYTATMTNENTIESEFVVLDIAGSGKATPFFNANASKLSFNTETTSEGTKWTANGDLDNASGQILKIIGKIADSGKTKIGLSLTTNVVNIDESGNVSVDSTNTFAAEVLKNSKIIFTNTDSEQSSDVITYTYDKVESKWVCTDDKEFTIDSQYKVTLSVISFDYPGALSESDIVFQMTLKYDSDVTQPSP